ncbi:MAG TPA: MarR family transcriptional regulator [Candidatus Saccharimonadia bacterium]|nr:MarR family transcriptional regulator [Candidatus Saccharimonadia bacterium]
MTMQYHTNVEHLDYSSIGELLTQNNAFLLAMLGAESRRRFTEAVEALDMGWQGQNVITSLCVFAQYGAVSQRQLADFVCVDPRNLVTVIDNLEQQGLLKRVPNPTDRRGYQMQITKKGKAIAERIQKLRTELEADMLVMLTAQEKTTLHGLLKKVWESTDVSSGFREAAKAADDETKGKATMS